MPKSPTFSLRARCVFAIDRPPIRDGWITITNGQIAAVGNTPTGKGLDLGDVAILPALINAHTHLEFSDLDRPLGEPAMPFTDWIREVIRWRRDTVQRHQGTNRRTAAIRNGLAESVQGGSATLGEIATLPWSESERRYEGMQGVCFLELLGLAPERHDELLAAANEFVDTFERSGLSWQRGLSPHAPYTVSPKLVESVAALSARTHVPVAMHLAETREELQLLRSAGGPFRELLDELGAWHCNVIPPKTKPMNYLKLLSKAERSLIIHGNYLTPQEIEFVGHQSERMSIIYCPRTHDYFAHDRYPLREMLNCGVNVALGTDSRASNPDLNMLSELRFAAKQHPDLSLESMLRLATINAAMALGMRGTHGTLTPGKQADFVVIPISSNEQTDPHELLFDSVQGVRQLFRNGEQLFPFRDGTLI